MAISPIHNNYMPYAANVSPAKYGAVPSEVGKETPKASAPADKDTFTKSSDVQGTDSAELKKLSSGQLREIKDQQTASYQKMINDILTSQAGKASQAQNTTKDLNADMFSKLTVTPEQQAAAQQAISEDGEWGVNAVATRIVDMAVSLSGGDPSKVSELRAAVEKGFKQAGLQWGQKLPSICQDTYDEVGKRFDYWEEHGSMNGYEYNSEKK